MYEKFYSCIKRRGAVAIGLAIASLSTLSTTALAAGDLQLPEINPVPVGQAATDGAQVQQSTPTKGSTIAKTALGLDTLYQEYQQYKATAAVQAVGPFRSEQTMAQVTTDNRVVIDAVAVTDPQALKGELEALGAVVTGVAGNMVSAELPIDQLPALSNLSSLLFARPVIFFTEAGLVTSQGDQAIGADTARSRYSVNGAGVTVGVISSSYNCLGGAPANVASGDLPPNVIVLKEISNCGIGGDEGRALAQIVRDVAPGANIQFHTGAGGEANMVQAIKNLQAAGSNIIVVDLGFPAEPFFQDGVIAQAVDSAVAAGVTYFAAAGNSDRQSYDDAFRPSTFYSSGSFGPSFLGGKAHDFDPDPDPNKVDNFQQITCSAGNTLTLSLQWDNPFRSLGGPPPAADIDIYLLDDPPTKVIARSTASQPPNDPLEILTATCTSTFNGNLMIVLHTLQTGKPAPSRIKYVLFGSSTTSGITINEYNTKSPTIVGHRNAAGAIAVGASAYFLTPAFGTNPPVLDHYSSAGGVPILFNPDGTHFTGGVRAKPEITAPDGGDNTFFGRDWEPNSWPNFFGTSAAAPHAAAVAALMRQANPNLTPAAIKKEMQSTAIDIVERLTTSFDDLSSRVWIGKGFDNDSGAGLIDAQAAVAAGVRCYVDADGDIDQNDLSLISRARGQIPAPNDPRDANGDGKINPADVQACIPRCTRANCATR